MIIKKDNHINRGGCNAANAEENEKMSIENRMQQVVQLQKWIQQLEGDLRLEDKLRHSGMFNEISSERVHASLTHLREDLARLQAEIEDEKMNDPKINKSNFIIASEFCGHGDPDQPPRAEPGMFCTACMDDHGDLEDMYEGLTLDELDCAMRVCATILEKRIKSLPEYVAACYAEPVDENDTMFYISTDFEFPMFVEAWMTVGHERCYLGRICAIDLALGNVDSGIENAVYLNAGVLMMTEGDVSVAGLYEHDAMLNRVVRRKGMVK